MISYMKRMAAIVVAAFIIASCTETKTNTEEQTEINKMDSTSKVIKENKEKLEEQTKKVEESVEKIDKEFETND